MPRRKLTPYEKQLRQEKRDAAEVAKTLLPVLEKDKDWALVTGKEPNMGETRFLRARTRLTKKAVQLLQPNMKISCTAGHGTAWNWVYVRLIVSEEPSRELSRKLRTLTENVLTALNIGYGTYFTDYGPDLGGGICQNLSVQVEWDG